MAEKWKKKHKAELEKRKLRGDLNNEVCVQNLKDIQDVYKKYNTRCWLTSGTLLGFVRDGKVIGHDHDTDLGAYGKEINVNIIKEIVEKGFSLKQASGDIDDCFTLKFNRDGITTDIFHFYEKDKHTVYHALRFAGDRYEYIYKKFKTDFLHLYDYDFMIPKDYMTYLIENYGQDWDQKKEEWHPAFSPPHVVKTTLPADHPSYEPKFRAWFNDDEFLKKARI